MAKTKTGMITAEEFINLPDDGKRRELAEGELGETTPAGALHGKVAMSLGVILGHFVKTNGLGEVLAAETGFILTGIRIWFALRTRPL